MVMMKNLQEVHDQLVAARPADATCPEDCPFCSGEYASFVDQGGNVSEATFTQEDVDALVAAAIAKAVAPLQAELNGFKEGEQESAVEAQVAAVREEMEAQIAELTSKLDAAVLEAETAKTERDGITQWLETESEKIVQEAELATRRGDRITKVAEVVSFPEDYVKERADKWASLSDEDFEALLADYKALGIKPKSGGTGSPLPTATAMVASRESAGGNGTVGSALKDLIQNRHDPRAIR